MFVEVCCVMFRLLCRVEEGSDQLGYVALRYGSSAGVGFSWVS